MGIVQHTRAMKKLELDYLMLTPFRGKIKVNKNYSRITDQEPDRRYWHGRT